MDGLSVDSFIPLSKQHKQVFEMSSIRTNTRLQTLCPLADSSVNQSREWVDGSWVMDQMGHENRMGHMGHGSLGVDP